MAKAMDGHANRSALACALCLDFVLESEDAHCFSFAIGDRDAFRSGPGGRNRGREPRVRFSSRGQEEKVGGSFAASERCDTR